MLGVKVEYTEEASMMDSELAVSSPPGSTTSCQPSQQQGVPFDFEGGFEPQTRARSNTWPLPRTDGYVDGNLIIGDTSDAGGSTADGICSAGAQSGNGIDDVGTPPQQRSLRRDSANSSFPVKKNSSRRNAWGKQSYADLITQAITSSPGQRLTLSQIYEWMVQNIDYFSDKADNNSSAGWKNSIRHNLSLHCKFIKMQNEGTGKSSWWMINHDAKPGKSPRRRATSMETGKLEKKRIRAKKKVEAMRNGVLQPDATPSPSNSVSEGLDLFPDNSFHSASGFQLSPSFRPRAPSNSSSCGRLSPIPAVLDEPDWTLSCSSEQLDKVMAGRFAETMRLKPQETYQTSPPNHQQQTGPPPSYFETQYQRSNSLRTDSSSFGLPPTPQPITQQRCPIHRLQQCACQMNLSPVSGMSPSYQQSEPSPAALENNQLQTLQYMIQNQRRQQQQQQQQQQQPPPPPPPSGPASSSPPNTPSLCGPTPSTMMGQLMGALNNSALLDDLNINIETLHGGFDCNVEEVINHELSMDGTLDFNFQQGVMGTAAIQVSDSNIAPNGVVSPNNGVGTVTGNATAGVYVSTNAATPAAPPSWVH